MAPVFLAPFSRSGVYVRCPDDLPPGNSSVSVQKVTAPVCVEKNPCTFLQISIGCRTEPYTTCLRGTVSAICTAYNIRFQSARSFPGAPPPCLSSFQIRPYCMKLPLHGPGCSSATLGRGHSGHSSHPHDSVLVARAASVNYPRSFRQLRPGSRAPTCAVRGSLRAGRVRWFFCRIDPGGRE